MAPRSHHTSSAGPLHDTAAARIVNGHARTITIVFLAEVFCLLLIALVHVHHGVPKAWFAVASTAEGILTIRAGFSHVLVVGPARVKARTLMRTRSWNYGELQWAKEVLRTRKGRSRTYIVLGLKTRRPYSFRAGSDEADAPSLTTRTVREINARILSSTTLAFAQARQSPCRRGSQSPDRAAGLADGHLG